MKYSFFVWLDDRIYTDKFDIQSPSLDLAIHNFYLNKPGCRSLRYTIRVLVYDRMTVTELGLIKFR